MRCEKKFKSFGWDSDVRVIVNYMIIPLCDTCKKAVVEFIYEKN